MHEEWQTSCKNGDTGRKIYNIILSVSLRPTNWITEAVIFFSQHGPCPAYLKRFHLSDSDYCSCGGIGTALHYATECILTVPRHMRKPVPNFEQECLKRVANNLVSRHKIRRIVKFIIENRDLFRPPYPSTFQRAEPTSSKLPDIPLSSLQKRKVYDALNGIPGLQVYLKEEIPEHYHIKQSRLTLPILLVASKNYYIKGVSLKKNYISPPLQMVDIYGILCELLGIQPLPNNGTKSITKGIVALPYSTANELPQSSIQVTTSICVILYAFLHKYLACMA
ncbi:hypothetical protein AVEN_152113-1 [Araneus ventricosus]|uniref:Uncharacterized protein n=1 Tax=Araneus ventricosus TaxID=182803 RepID=A0A4Y2NVQ5_ARAVE|nr:hypothetical protein AVEN_152113-1 [Araneus ventricosus]